MSPKTSRSGEKSVTEKQKEILTARGYTGITVDDVFDDILLEKTNYHADEILKSTYPLFKKLSNANIPAFRYLREAGITDRDAFQACPHADARLVANRTLGRGFTANGYRNQFDRDFKGLTTQEIIDRTTPEKASLMLPFQPRNEVDLAVLAKFLRDNSDRLKQGSYRSYFKKLACMYDYLAFGFEL